MELTAAQAGVSLAHGEAEKGVKVHHIASFSSWNYFLGMHFGEKGN